MSLYNSLKNSNKNSVGIYTAIVDAKDFITDQVTLHEVIFQRDHITRVEKECVEYFNDWNPQTNSIFNVGLLNGNYYLIDGYTRREFLRKKYAKDDLKIKNMVDNSKFLIIIQEYKTMNDLQNAYNHYDNEHSIKTKTDSIKSASKMNNLNVDTIEFVVKIRNALNHLTSLNTQKKIKKELNNDIDFYRMQLDRLGSPELITDLTNFVTSVSSSRSEWQVLTMLYMHIEKLSKNNREKTDMLDFVKQMYADHYNPNEVEFTNKYKSSTNISPVTYMRNVIANRNNIPLYNEVGNNSTKLTILSGMMYQACKNAFMYGDDALIPDWKEYEFANLGDPKETTKKIMKFFSDNVAYKEKK